MLLIKDQRQLENLYWFNARQSHSTHEKKLIRATHFFLLS